MLEHRKKTFLVTGANTGIGYETAKALAGLGGRVIIAVRSLAKGQAALDRLAAETGSGQLSMQQLDLADLSSITRAAEALTSEERIDVLVNNAGLGNAQGGVTKDGFGLVMGTNHMGTFAFTEALMGKLKETAKRHGEVRIINLSSAAHQFARKFDPKDLFPEKRGLARDAYCESKLANLLHAREMARRYGMAGIRAHAVHPGFVHSEFGRRGHFPGAWQALFLLTRPMQISTEKGAKTSIAAALSDDGAWNNGQYWEKEAIGSPSLPSDPDQVARTLWKETERLWAEKGFAPDHGQADDRNLPPGGAFPSSL